MQTIAPLIHCKIMTNRSMHRVLLLSLLILADALISRQRTLFSPATSFIIQPLKFATNKQAGYEYGFEEKYEAGIKLCGTEVKSCRKSQVQLSDGHVQITDGECWLLGVHIAEYAGCGSKFQHPPKRARKLLLSRKEILKIEQRILQRNMEIIPIRMYFSERQLVKVELGVGRKKSVGDKRDTIEGREADRDVRRVMKSSGGYD